ncbi:methyltransferase [Falsiroseomonas tokyonensis]|uniref:Methyltransferase n=1 Tax=Falsiroseomonas tokyonensis TaxID=430521 RepID=A0ABV7C0E4_9PROT|nr:methyltransferase [Falsiroseomonas tokyonensis]MBU8539924.1 methyltransferase [Falsiroseomonas tokyonensis]
MQKQTYGQLWDVYVAESFPRLQKEDQRLAWPGQEWGNEASWQRIFDKLFVPAGVQSWQAAIEIGGGSGKYTERVLRAGQAVRVWGFDVSRNFLDATAARLGDDIKAGRLSLHEIDAAHPDGMFTLLAEAGQARRLDAVFSIDAMVHVDLTYLTTYWMNAALLLKPGGRVLMTLADPNTGGGFQKILRDIRKFYRMQGRICPKFEYLSTDIVRAILTRLGFEIELLEPWSNHPGRPPRDLYLSARLADPAKAEAFRDALRADPAATPPGQSGRPDSYADYWTREASRALAGRGDRPDAAAVRRRLFDMAEIGRWRRAIEIGTGDARFTAEVLQANPTLQLTVFDVSERLMKAAAAKLPEAVAAGRLGFQPVDPVHPDGMLKLFEREGLARDIDAVFSIDAMVHVDLQYQLAYWLNAALLLRPGGWLVLQLADATTEAGFARLLADIRRYFAFQGQTCARFEFQSYGLVRPLLEKLGFDITYAGHWNPRDGSESGRDLFIVAQLARPEQAEALRAHIAIGLAVPNFAATPAEPPSAAPSAPPAPPRPAAAQTLPEPVMEDLPELSRTLGQSIWRQLHLRANPGLSSAKLREDMQELWAGNRREWTRLGETVLLDLAGRGLILKRPGQAGGAGKPGAADESGA